MVLEELFYTDALPYAAAFLAFFAVIFFLLNKSMFRQNRAISTIISVSISVLIVFGLSNYTELMDSFSFFLNDLGSSIRALIFIAVIILILLLLYKGFSRGLRRYDFPIFLFAIAGALILVAFLPNLVSVYYLPEFFQVNYIRWMFGIAGIAVFLLALKKIRKATKYGYERNGRKVEFERR